MKGVLRYILALAVLLFAQGTAVRADNDRASWEELLDRYELICRKCITLKQRQDAGEAIPSRQLLSLMDELETLRCKLKTVSDKMPAYAFKRYNAIRQMYASGVIVETLQEQVAVLGKGFLPAGASVSGSSPLPDISPLPVAPRPWPAVVTVAASASVPELAYGLSGAYWGQRFGYWGAVRSTFSYHRTSYSALSDGSREGGRIWTSGEAATDRLFATAGPLVRISKTLALFGGAGYGFKRLCWEDSNGDWMIVRDASGRGICFEAGASVLLGRSALSLSWLCLPST